MAWTTADGIRVYTRADWGAHSPNGNFSNLGSLRTLVYHHGGPVGPPRMTFDAASKTCRDWQAFHQNTNGWTDIGYHFLMDGLGRIYLGRPAWALGAHVLSQNTGRLGLNYMQDGRFHGLTDGQMKTTRKLFSDPHHRLHIPALKDLANRPGDFGVFGHREVPGQSTECPGDKIAADLHGLIRDFT